MSPRLFTIFILIVLVPLGLLGWLGTKLAKEETERLNQSLEGVMQQRLIDMDRLVQKVVGDIEREMLALSDKYSNIPQSDVLREIARKNRFIRQVFIRNDQREFVHPPITGPLQTEQERAFFDRTGSVWESGIQFYEPTNDAWQAEDRHGWHSWFWGERVNFLFWRQLPSGFEIGVEIETTALIAELIAQFPTYTAKEFVRTANPYSSPETSYSIRLIDASEDVLYQWGDFDPAKERKANAEIALSAPLKMWNLQYFQEIQDTYYLTSVLPMPILASLIAVALVLIILAIYFYRENTRELRTAAQRVSFVNQVSHELKTPLTNIRMYAELMEAQMPDDSSSGSKKYLQVITDESRRLSRLISNVLTFAKSQREELQIHKLEKSPDAIVNAVLDSFRPALETREFSIELDLNAKEKMMLDPDILEQILGNLINNVEKYAASGKYLKISTMRNGEYLEIVVTDKGSGIPDNQKESIFLPFHRISNALSDGVTGTGIGLSIARNQARMHGGELSVVKCKEGATFRIELK
jgi:signal transduction histidine kinase